MGDGGRRWMSRRLDALVERVCPPQVTELGVAPAVVAETRRMIDAASPPVRQALRATLAAMGARIPVPAPAARAVRDLLVTIAYEQPHVHASLGYDLGDWVSRTADHRARRWGEEIRGHAHSLLQSEPLVRGAEAKGPGAGGRFVSASDLGAEGIECDAVVVGSGAGGAVVAAELAEAGWEVVVLEEGPYVPTERFTTDALASFRTLYREGGLTALLGKPPIAYIEGRCVGGSTTVNGGMAWRTPEPVLECWRREHGLERLAAAALDPLFERVERRLSVSLQDQDSIGRDQELLRAGAEGLGWALVDNRRAQVHCGGCNVCILGCPTGAKQSTLVSYLPRAVAFGATVVSDCRVERVLFDGKLASGVQAVAAGGGRLVVRAPVVVVAAGAIETPALLLRSGVSSPSGQLGRNLAIHPGASVVALFDEPVEGWKGVHQAYQVREFADEGVLMAAVNLPPGLVARSLSLTGDALGSVMAGYDRMVTAGVLVDDTSTGRVRSVAGRAVASYALSAGDGHRIVEAVAKLCELLFAAGATRIYLPFAGIGPVGSVSDLTRLRADPIEPSRIAVSTVHLMGTARMGADPVRSVCDPSGRVNDAAGLYVADASLLPTPLGVNPMETIMVLATLVAQDLITGKDAPR